MIDSLLPHNYRQITNVGCYFENDEPCLSNFFSGTMVGNIVVGDKFDLYEEPMKKKKVRMTSSMMNYD